MLVCMAAPCGESRQRRRRLRAAGCVLQTAGRAGQNRKWGAGLGLFDRLKKSAPPADAVQAPPKPDWDEVYSGMRVETTTMDGQRLLFAAKMQDIKENTAKLYQYTEPVIPDPEEPLQVRIRGYNDRTGHAVYMEGTILPGDKHIWHVENLVLVRAGRDRAFYRLDTNLNGTATSFQSFSAGEKPCRLINISVGGACVGSAERYREQDKFLLKVQLLEDREVSVLLCQVLRVVEKEDGRFEYGCRFLGMNEDSEAKISQNIFMAQIKRKR